jgi:hypothetical protein
MKPAQLSLISLLLALLCFSCAEVHNSPAKVDPPLTPDLLHIWVTTGQPPKGKPYKVLGKISYTEPWSNEATNADRMAEKLKALGLAKYPDTLDALIKEESQLSWNGKSITVVATAIQYEDSQRRGPSWGPHLMPPPYLQMVVPPEAG